MAAAAACLALVASGCGSSSSAAPSTGTSSGPVHVTWMDGFDAPGTPARYDKVGVLEVGSRSARNVLVLEPGTSAAGAYFVPLAKWIVSKDSSWQVWSVERRENLLEDQSVLDLYKQHEVTTTELFDYYLGYLKDPGITHHYQVVPNSSVGFASQWGMDVAVQDLRIVIDAANRLGGKVVLGGHSLGGAVVTAYATWDFGGRPGADDLAGLVYIDGASAPTPMTPRQATQDLQSLNAPDASPWLSFGGITAPYAGLFEATGAASALQDPDAPSLGQTSGLLPPDIVPPVPVTNLGQYGYALNVATSPPSLEAAQGHLGQGIAAAGPVHGWNGTGALTPIDRFASMFEGAGIQDANGTEWYFPQRLTDDTGAVADGNANPAQTVLGVDATMGHSLPRSLLIYAFAAHLGGQGVLDATTTLARQSGIPMGNLTLVDRQSTYAHNDPAGAYPDNAFFRYLMPFLAKVGSHG
jgi:pimeloyl-ACP methyl ester carboxylesterase